jgi:glutaminyl-peptide cyclotransferase
MIWRLWRWMPLLILLCASPLDAQPAGTAPVQYGYTVVHTYPHDRTAFTEGLFYLNGALYESTGNGETDRPVQGQIRKVDLATGAVIQSRKLAPQYYGEGIVNWGGRLIELTWRNQIGFVYDLASFKLERSFIYPGEGWALTQNGRELVMSDGTPAIRFLNPRTLKETHRITVTLNGAPIDKLNEIEWVKGEIYANVWLTNYIVRIDPTSGAVVGVIDLTGLLSPAEQSGLPDDVLNGIAYDPKGDRLFVTGKRWPKLFEIRLVKKAP